MTSPGKQFFILLGSIFTSLKCCTSHSFAGKNADVFLKCKENMCNLVKVYGMQRTAQRKINYRLFDLLCLIFEQSGKQT